MKKLILCVLVIAIFLVGYLTGDKKISDSFCTLLCFVIGFVFSKVLDW